MEASITNDQLVLVAGLSGAGKSASLRNLRNKERWVYINAESGKRLPFKNSFINRVITDPMDVIDIFDDIIENYIDDIDGIIIDSITFLMDMVETQYVLNAANTMKAWADYNQFFKVIMQQKVPAFGKPVLILAHVKDELDEQSMELKTAVPIKGALKNQGIEAYFSTVVMAQKIRLTELADMDQKLLQTSEEERELGFQHTFQTRVTKKTTGTRIRSPMGMFNKNQTYIANDCQLLLDHLNEFYN